MSVHWAACYRDGLDRNFNPLYRCKCFLSLFNADDYLSDHIAKNGMIESTVLPTNCYYPMFLKKMSVVKLLKPSVEFSDNKSHRN